MAEKQYIVIAEDDPFYGNILKTKLVREGFDVVIAKNGEEALENLNKRLPNLLIMNLIMPVKDGFTLLHEVRASKKFEDLKVLVLSNLGEEEDKKRIMDMKAIDYLVKVNVALSEILEKIKSSLQ